MSPTSPTARTRLVALEPRLRNLLPADLYANYWISPSSETLMHVFEHLRTLRRILSDYVPRQVSESLPQPGQARYEWQEGSLMFTDLAGFTPLMEASARHGREGALILMDTLNRYFAAMIEIISKSGGSLLEFTGDAMLALFPATPKQNDARQAVHAGLRMQRAMQQFAQIEVLGETFELGMRIGIHTGRFLTADIGTPRRMENVLLGGAVRETKKAEGAGEVGRVCMTFRAFQRVSDLFEFDDGKPGYMLLVDNLSERRLGEYDISFTSRRMANPVLFDRSMDALAEEIEGLVNLIEPLASYLPAPVLDLAVAGTARRRIPPRFPELVVMFVNLLGLPEAVDSASEGQEDRIVSTFSRAFALINAAVEAQGGVLKHVTYHLSGSDMLIYFGTPNAHTDDAVRAARAALAIRDTIQKIEPISVGNSVIEARCQIGIAKGPVFAAEIGEPRGRREFNILGDTVNTAARLMSKAASGQILLTDIVHDDIREHFTLESLGELALKGKSSVGNVYNLLAALEDED
ncbi:MAG: adenylate/guanylate cyclase domain-containing protein [bacterium]|nr:adenylate/guanylate cyclase domain-containing protein [bacterium]